MATISVPNLTLSLPFMEGGQKKVIITVTYNAVFTLAEQSLLTLLPGLEFLETIQVIGVDPANGFTGDILIEKALPVEAIPLTSGGPLTIQRTRTMKALRTLLQEDPAPGDADEIRCKIKISSVFANAFTNASGFTNVATLAG